MKYKFKHLLNRNKLQISMYMYLMLIEKSLHEYMWLDGVTKWRCARLVDQQSSELSHLNIHTCYMCIHTYVCMYHLYIYTCVLWKPREHKLLLP